MTKNIFFIFIFISSIANAQSWQWGKRGGALEQLSNETFHRQEEVYSLATDSHKNIYGLSRVGYTSLNIDGVIKANFDNPSWYPSDYTLFSFACDGTYRWSKVIGGAGNETVNRIQVDNQDNVFVCGKFRACAINTSYPHRIDNDIIIPSNPQDCRNLFLAKYNDSGVLQWIKRPQPLNVDETLNGFSASRDLQMDADGNSYWLVQLPPDTYEDGAFVNTMPGNNYFILKYDTSGNYTGNLPIDIQTYQGYGYLRMYRNKYNGFFYIVSDKVSDTDSAVVAGSSITYANFIACFNAQGAYQWHRESTFIDPNFLLVYNLDFDAQNNIYIGGKIAGFSFGSFLGLTVPESIIPGFVMKTNPNATQVLWSSYNNKGTENYGGIVLNGNELAYTSYCFGTDFTWGTQTLSASAPNQGQEVLLARFNKNSGACIGLTKIPGSVGFDDIGASIAADASGDYIVGGAIGGSMFFGNGQQIDNAGSQSDFFIAKYATQACSPLAVNENTILAPTVYPNPTKGTITIKMNQDVLINSVKIYNILGQLVQVNTNPNETVDVSGLKSGTYFIKISSDKGTVSSKFVKE